jgi:hypothetical protein
VRVIVADHLADDLRALAVRAVRREAHLPHREQHAPMGGLQAVADVGKRAPDDYAHRVIHVRALHLVFDIDRNSRVHAEYGARLTAKERSAFGADGVLRCRDS